MASKPSSPPENKAKKNVTNVGRQNGDTPKDGRNRVGVRPSNDFCVDIHYKPRPNNDSKPSNAPELADDLDIHLAEKMRINEPVMPSANANAAGRQNRDTPAKNNPDPQARLNPGAPAGNAGDRLSDRPVIEPQTESNRRHNNDFEPVCLIQVCIVLYFLNLVPLSN